MRKLTQDATLNPIAGIAILATLPLCALWRAYVMTKLWLWFIVPLGARAVSTMEMFGALFVFSVVTYGIRPWGKREEEDDVLVRAFIMYLVKYPFAYAVSLGIGYVLRFWILG